MSLGCLWNLKEAMVAGAVLAGGREAVGETMGLEGKITFYFMCLLFLGFASIYGKILISHILLLQSAPLK